MFLLILIVEVDIRYSPIFLLYFWTFLGLHAKNSMFYFLYNNYLLKKQKFISKIINIFKLKNNYRYIIIFYILKYIQIK